MPRYFFNVHLGEDVLEDPEGQEFRDADEAWEATRATALDLMKAEFSQPVNWASCYIEVKNEAGEIILEFPFLEAVDMTRQLH
ncbi:DUF6894 family protein [Microvirga sp. 2TAF3]|uniref:DUF6894 family protein n=1 Tax=Microvirga sp. 2TAF3 TaxID=3233014 RepID=UPI003F971BDD